MEDYAAKMLLKTDAALREYVAGHAQYRDAAVLAALAELRRRGYRLTPQRQLVLEAVGELGHATPEEIVTAVRRTASGVNISTVYRTLELLEELGLVQHAHLGHGASTYSVTSDDDHVHLVCRDCGGIEEAPPSVVATVVAELAAT